MKNVLSLPIQYLCSPLLAAEDRKDDIDFESILTRDELVVQQNHICSVIGAPTTMIQFRKESDGNWDRIDSQLSSISLRSSCHTLRTCVKNGESLCKRCDSQHADLFRGLHEKDMGTELQKRINKAVLQLRKEYHHKDYTPEVAEINGRCYLTYGCPILGYTEHIFPILFDERVVGVLFLGQIRLANNKKDGINDAQRIRETKERYFENHPLIFDEYAEMARKKRKTSKKYSAEMIRRYILESSIRAIRPYYPPLWPMIQDMHNPTIPDELSPGDYCRMLNLVTTQLHTFEEHLSRRIKEKREAVIRDTVDHAVARFRSADSKAPYEDLISLWKNVDVVIGDIVNRCGMKAAYVYSSNSISQKDNETLVLVSKMGRSVKSVRYGDTRTAICPLKSLQPLPNEPIDSDKLPALLSIVPLELDSIDSMFALLLPVNRLASASVLVIFSFADDYSKAALSKLIMNAVISFFALLSSRLSELFENTTQLYLERVLRMYKHEINHLASGMVVPISYLDEPKLMRTGDKKLKDVYRDAAGTLDMLAFMADNIETLLDMDFEPEFEDVPINQKLLFKWENIFREAVHNKQTEFFFKNSWVVIKTDPRYSELVIYNLFSNAVKYSFTGAKIYFDCKETFHGSDRYVLSIVNYSTNIKMEDLNQLFSFGYRYVDDRGNTVDGSGIGLFVANQIMERLGGTINIKPPRFLSKYNIPMLHAFLVNEESWCSPIYTQAKEAYERLKRMSIVNPLGERVDGLDLVLTDRYRYGTDMLNYNEVLDALCDATYEIRFEVIF